MVSPVSLLMIFMVFLLDSMLLVGVLYLFYNAILACCQEKLRQNGCWVHFQTSSLDFSALLGL